MSKDQYTVVSAMKNEGPFILEWVAHYKTLGFDNIIVCTNDCTDPTVEILRRLQEMGLAVQHNTIVRGGGIHRSALRQATRRYDFVMESKWIFVCDIDEFLNIHVGDGSARALVAASGDDVDVISVPWRNFGPDGREEFVDELVTKQFTKGELPWDAKLRPDTGKFVKSLYTNQDKFQRAGLHAPVPKDDMVDRVKRVLPGGALYVKNGARTENPPLFEHAQVNHYALKSLDSYLVQRARGRANHTHQTIGMEYWNRFNHNDVLDQSIDRYAPQVDAMVAELKADKVLCELHEQAVDWHRRKALSIKMDPDMDALVGAVRAAL